MDDEDGSMRHKKMAGAVGGSTVLACAMLAAAQPPAQANPSWELFDASNGAEVVYTDTVTASGVLQFSGIRNGSGFNLACNLPAGLLSHTFASPDPLSGAPNGTISIEIIPPAVISTLAAGPKQGVCRDGTVPLDVTTTGAAWTLTVDVPDVPANLPASDYITVGTDAIYIGGLDVALDVPDQAITLSDSTVGCTGTGPLVPPTSPSTAPPFTGTYDSSTGHLSADANQFFDLDSNDCFFEEPHLVSGELDLDPILTLVY